MLLLRLSGWLLLRLAERRLSGLLFHEPPRRTREDGAVQALGRRMECACHGPEAEEIRPSEGEIARILPDKPAVGPNFHCKKNTVRLRRNE